MMLQEEILLPISKKKIPFLPFLLQDPYNHKNPFTCHIYEVVSFPIVTMLLSVHVMSPMDTVIGWCDKIIQWRRKGGSVGLEPPNFGAHSNEVISHMNAFKVQKTYPWSLPMVKHFPTQL